MHGAEYVRAGGTKYKLQHCKNNSLLYFGYVKKFCPITKVVPVFYPEHLKLHTNGIVV